MSRKMNFFIVGDPNRGYEVRYRGAGGSIKKSEQKTDVGPNKIVCLQTIIWRNGTRLVIKLQRHYTKNKWQSAEIEVAEIAYPAIIEVNLNGTTVFTHNDNPLLVWFSEIQSWLWDFPKFPGNL